MTKTSYSPDKMKTLQLDKKNKKSVDDKVKKSPSIRMNDTIRWNLCEFINSYNLFPKMEQEMYTYVNEIRILAEKTIRTQYPDADMDILEKYGLCCMPGNDELYHAHLDYHHTRFIIPGSGEICVAAKLGFRLPNDHKIITGPNKLSVAILNFKEKFIKYRDVLDMKRKDIKAVLGIAKTFDQVVELVPFLEECRQECFKLYMMKNRSCLKEDVVQRLVSDNYKNLADKKEENQNEY